MSGDRPRKVAGQIHRYLSTELIRSVRDPRLGFATVTSVDVSPDLKSARVFVTILEPDPCKRTEAVEALNGAAGRFRREMGRLLHLRHVPSLRFEEDRAIERADRIERLIEEIHRSAPDGDESE